MNQQYMLGLRSQEHGGELEFWETPRWAVDAVIPIVHERMLRRSGHWDLLDPGCGTGAIALAILASAAGRNVSMTYGIEIDETRADAARTVLGTPADVRVGDFLIYDHSEHFRAYDGYPLLVCGNPPYAKALEFVERSIEIASRTHGIVAMLLQLDFATGVKRSKLHEQQRSALYPLRRRPNFGGKHSSGQRPFAWFVWDLFDPYSEWKVIG